MPKGPHILKAFYEYDIVDESVIIEWHEAASRKYTSKEVSKEIHAKAAPFIQWLKEAEEESSDEDEDGVDVEYSESGSSSLKMVPVKTLEPVSNGDGAAELEESDAEDVDIDAI
jgi:translation initiation factor 5